MCLEAARNTTWDPVCANDGQTFQNFLAFQCYVRFFRARGLSVRRGACSNQPVPDYCMFSFVVWRQVCGADNVTYSSPWELMCNAQRTRVPNHVEYDGPCRLRCAMSLVYDPICGSDGVDYPNPEALRCAAQRNPGLQAARRGPCAPEAPVAACRTMARARSRESPVCASNGVTYPSHAHVLCLREYNPKLRILHDGPCRMEDVDTRPLDIVRLCHYADHTALWMPLCASDGRTYPNLFVLKCAQARLLMPKDVTVERAGECEASEGQTRAPEDEDEDACQRAAAEPRVIDRPLFCANDGRTYYNHRHYACAVQRDGDWFPYHILRLNMPCEAADTPCERLRLMPDALHVDPVCANDGITYASPLALMCAMANNEGEPLLPLSLARTRLVPVRTRRPPCARTTASPTPARSRSCAPWPTTKVSPSYPSLSHARAWCLCARVDPVCASDGITYASPLALMCAMANNEGLKRHHRGQCLSESEEEGGHGHNHGGGGGHQGGDAGSQGGNNSNNGNGGSDPGGNSNGNGGGDGGTPGDNTGAGSGGTDAGGDDYDDNQEAGGNGTNQSQNQEPQGPPGSEGAPESTESPETSGSPGSSGSPEPEGSQEPQPKPPAENPRKDDAEELDLSREPR
ncbi:hypothetical protein R5R35_010262 [Gryllus longicercus]|uniref:Kazal-like domain-containing protein n=1 Tax=Gryllus longicercus TaxID=2509291 RepID=A0AAN9VFC6_9ORTH